MGHSKISESGWVAYFRRQKEGRKKAKTEYKRDSKTAFELGRDATIYGHATAKSLNRTIKIENKLAKQYEKDPDGLSRKTQKLRKKMGCVV